VHVSGHSIISDRCDGAHVENPKEWTDKDLDVTKLPHDSVHMTCELPIAEAGSRDQYPIRTFVLNPALIYGVGAGIQRTSFWLRDWVERSQKAGHSGTFGEGANDLSYIHVRDTATALLFVLRAALKGEVKGGADCNYFVGVSRTKQTAWAKVIGDYMHEKGLVKEPGYRPWPQEITGPKGDEWWWAYAGNHLIRPDRLYSLGWEPTETMKQGPIDNLPEAMAAAVE